ncbi:MAG: CDP-alcohol phosphatidyltransferase [Chloroflexi bacterium RBG_16_56_11]|nr:MAG: CDP-alcohol phosphatidyltransferase [Chloroflexi bacterium RBG_16_56_11]
MPELDKSRKSLAGRVTHPLVSLLARTPLTPNSVTWLGFLVTLVAAGLVVSERLLAAGIVALVAGVFDMLDGALARFTGKVSRFGGILDSTLDRLSEAVLLLALLVIFVRDGQFAESILAAGTMLGSLMVSYIRARMESLGIECKAGLFTRPERVVVMSLGLILSRWDYALVIALGIIACFSAFTVVERLVYAWKHAKT